jgi:hypothetical protein
MEGPHPARLFDEQLDNFPAFYQSTDYKQRQNRKKADGIERVSRWSVVHAEQDGCDRAAFNRVISGFEMAFQPQSSLIPTSSQMGLHQA